MSSALLVAHLQRELACLKEQGLYKSERVMTSSQNTAVTLQSRHCEGAQRLWQSPLPATLPSPEHPDIKLNLCANNYLGLANHPVLIETAQSALAQYGFGMASVRFICGTQSVHKELEDKISAFYGTEDTILYSSCFDANGGFFEALLGPEDAVISDELNHASIIDGIRLSKAKRLRYRNNDMQDLADKLQEASEMAARFKIIATDGVFSMDGSVANLAAICDLAEQYHAMVMVDDCHATGFLGKTGRGTAEYCGVDGRVDIITSTLGKALGGASGGYTTGPKPIIDWLRNRSRPYLFSNTLAPVIAATELAVFDLIEGEAGDQLRQKLQQNQQQFRRGMTKLGFDLLPGEHPITPIMLGDAKLAADMAAQLLQHGIYVVGFSYPVVPMNKARIRVQLSAAHTPEQIDYALDAFAKVGRQLKVI